MLHHHAFDHRLRTGQFNIGRRPPTQRGAIGGALSVPAQAQAQAQAHARTPTVERELGMKLGAPMAPAPIALEGPHAYFKGEMLINNEVVRVPLDSGLQNLEVETISAPRKECARSFY